MHLTGSRQPPYPDFPVPPIQQEKPEGRHQIATSPSVCDDVVEAVPRLNVPGSREPQCRLRSPSEAHGSPKVDFEVLPRLTAASRILSRVITEARVSLQSNSKVLLEPHARQRGGNFVGAKAESPVTMESPSRSEAHGSLQVDFEVLSGAHASLQVDFKVLSGAHVSLRTT